MRRILRVTLTALMYAGVLIFLFPYMTGRITAGLMFMIVGGILTVGCGLGRCYFTEGDCGRFSHVSHSDRDW